MLNKIMKIKKKKGGRQDIKIEKEENRVCSVCPVLSSGGETVKALVDADAPVSSQECAAEETALLGLFCNLHSLIAALGVVALLQYTQIRQKGCESSNNIGTGQMQTSLTQHQSNHYNYNDVAILLHSYQLLVHFCFDVSGEG